MAMGFEYLDFINARDRINQKYDVDLKSCILLRAVMQAYATDRLVTVSDVITLKHIASPVTLHTGIKELISKKLIATKSDPKDGRIKYLIPTARALKLYRELSNLVLNSQAAMVA